VSIAFGSLQDLQMLQGRRIDDERVCPLAINDGPDVCQVSLLRRAQVVQKAAGGADGGGPPVEPESFQPGGAELIQ